MTAMETLAALWIAEHPEYDAELSDEEAALAADYSVEGGRANPFLHLSMHLSISEQCSIDQPGGIRAAVEDAGRAPGVAARRPSPGDGVPGRDDLALAAQRRAARWPGVCRVRAPAGERVAGWLARTAHAAGA